MSVFVVALACAAVAQPSAEDIVSAVRTQAGRVNDYQVEVSVSVKGESISINNMQATLYYKKPNKIHVEPKSGVAMIPGGTYLGNPVDLISAEMNATYVKAEKCQGRDCHVVRLDPMPGSDTGHSVTLWIDKARSVILATDSNATQGFRTAWSYATVDGKYYLPVRIDAQMPAPQGDGKQNIKATVKLTNYRVNRGISDKVFVKKPRPNKGH